MTPPAAARPSPPESAFRLVLPRDKRERLARRVAALPQRRTCLAAGCAQQGLGVVLVESEVDAVLCPRHELVGLDGAPIAGRPIFVTAAW